MHSLPRKRTRFILERIETTRSVDIIGELHFLESMIKIILDKVDRHSSKLKTISHLVTFKLECVLGSENAQVGILLSPTLLSRIVQMNVVLGLRTLPLAKKEDASAT